MKKELRKFNDFLGSVQKKGCIQVGIGDEMNNTEFDCSIFSL